MTDVRMDASPALEAQTTPSTFIWYELMTPDPDGAKEFYDAVVGWNIEPKSNFPNGYRMIGRSDGKFAGGILPLTSEMAEHGAHPTWVAYLHCSDVDASARAIEQADGKILMPPFEIPEIGRVAMVADPQGAQFYLMKPSPPAGDPDAQSDVFSPREQQRVGWNELSTSDVDAALRFYEEQFGFTSDEFMPMGEMGEYRFLQDRGTPIGAAFRNPEGPSRWRFYFRVPSISAARKAAESRGATISMGPHQVPTGEWVIGGTDPQGAEFALVGGD